MQKQNARVSRIELINVTLFSVGISTCSHIEHVFKNKELTRFLDSIVATTNFGEWNAVFKSFSGCDECISIVRYLFCDEPKTYCKIVDWLDIGRAVHLCIGL